MRSIFFRDWGRFLSACVRILIVLGFLGPLAGRATFRQTLVLVLLIGLGVWLVGAVLQSLRPGNVSLSAAGEAFFAFLALRYLAGSLGAEFGWPGAFILGLAVGLLGLMGAERKGVSPPSP